MQKHTIDRRTACATLLGLGGSLLATGLSSGQDGSKPQKRPRVLPTFTNSDFYDSQGKFSEQAARKAYMDLFRYFRYPVNETLRKNLFVTDFALGRFTEVGLGCCVWVNDKQGNYTSQEVFLLPDQMIPEHWHVAIEAEKIGAKMESWHVRYGKTFTFGEGEATPDPAVKIHEQEAKFVTVMHQKSLAPGEVTGIVRPEEKHWQQAGPEGCILTETSTFHSGAAVKFTNPAIKF